MTHGPGEVVITGVGLAVPGASTPDALLRRTACPVTGPDPEPFDTAARIGRRGHRYKDRATRLALCAALEALRDADLLPSDRESDSPAGGPSDSPSDRETVTVPGDTIGVVASSNLGNLDTACLTTTAIAERSAVDLSPMSLPNASSNVIASWVAIRHGLRGPNLMLCNGPTSGLDAVHWGAALVAAGRVRRVVVVGAETHNAVVEDLLGRSAGELLDGAAALVVEGARWAEARGARGVAALGQYERRAGLTGCVEALLPDAAAPGVWFTPERYTEGPAGGVPVPRAVPRYDVTGAVGRASGALGVLQCVAAVGWLARAAATSGAEPVEPVEPVEPDAGAGNGTAFGAGPGGARDPVPVSRQALITSGDDTADAVAGLLLRPTPDRSHPHPARAPLISMECSR
ncbi:beta-ketoacyl synthase N-terminal-like domain-containing protein [Streptomyces malaysiensis]|uniref:Beta-ketoacyl synthase n=1 Tax=Streptomyces malaysiensis subsp. samsunensis TaxID=459658 RepID=A0A9X2RYD2_STRMQ|nr:beta-ketoacyl synthase N-terminal-like domain-containing protein [Streptomyces samsunensis]MCQ8832829.1 beta-ketoacyl synthase [Streptomyces samsunensis]